MLPALLFIRPDEVIDVTETMQGTMPPKADLIKDYSTLKLQISAEHFYTTSELYFSLLTCGSCS